ncbi:MAG: hypothetical protein HYY43_04500 [Deltaproteobacteria bacterium]|nr:hypothetical protein [Deltaproteobacteria bacterium]
MKHLSPMVLIILAVALLMVTGCGGGTNNSDGNIGTEEDTASTDNEAAFDDSAGDPELPTGDEIALEEPVGSPELATPEPVTADEIAVEDAAEPLPVTVPASTQIFRLIVSKIGDGSGTVLSSPAGINCGTTCLAMFNSGTHVKLTATPDPHFIFSGWGGDCTGTLNSVTITMNTYKKCIAKFETTGNKLSINIIGNGSVTINGGTVCENSCITYYPSDSKIALVAAGDAGWQFKNWSGDCYCAKSSCSIILSSNKSCTATFYETPVISTIPNWGKTYDSSAIDVGSMIENTSDNGFVILGRTDLYDTWSSNIWVIKTDSEGIPAWQYSYGYGYPMSIVQALDGGYVISGHSNQDFLVFKLLQDGSIDWQFAYDNGLNHENAKPFLQRADDGSGYYLVGTDIVVGDYFALKLDNNGNVIWQNKYSGSSTYDSVEAISATSDGGVIIAGISSSTIATYYYDVWVIKLKSDGTVSWHKRYNTEVYVNGSFIQEISGGFILGINYQSSANDIDVLLSKLDSQGKILWQKVYGKNMDLETENYVDVINSFTETSDGGYIMTGSTTNMYDIDYKSSIWTIKLNDNGAIVWQKMYSSPLLQLDSYSIRETPDNNFIILGEVFPFDMSDVDLLVLRIGSDGLISFNPASLMYVSGTTTTPVEAAIITPGNVFKLAPAAVAGTSKTTDAVKISTSAVITELAP